jgi:hypothetical protein
VKLGNPRLGEARRQSQAIRTAAADQRAANVNPIIEQIPAGGTTTLLGITQALPSGVCRPGLITSAD